MFELRKRGFKVPLSVLTEDECLQVVDDLMKGRIQVGE